MNVKDQIAALWLEVEPKVLGYCRGRWNGDGEDVLSETKVVFLEKASGGKFSYRSPGEAVAYARAIAQRVATHVVSPRREISLEALHEKGFDPPATEEGVGDERIEFLRRRLEGRAKKVLEAVILGADIDDACRAAKICRNIFVSECQKTWEKKDQLQLRFFKNE